MGLDMYAYATEEATSAEDFADLGLESREEFFYWRKHPNLHGWMEALYRSKGGTAKAAIALLSGLIRLISTLLSSS